MLMMTYFRTKNKFKKRDSHPLSFLTIVKARKIATSSSIIMIIMKHLSYYRLGFPILFLVWLHFEGNHGSTDFSREHITVWFDPWVSHTDIGVGDLHEYSEPELGAMLAKISTKFNRLLIRQISIGEPSPYAYVTLQRIPNVTANFNKARVNSGQPPLELVMQFKLDLSHKSGGSKTNFDIVKELADGANSIYPNTVRTLLLDHDDFQLNSSTVEDTREMLVHSRAIIRNETLSPFQYNLSIDLDFHQCLNSNSRVPAYLIPILRIVDGARFFVKISPARNPLPSDLQVALGKLTRFFDNCKAKLGAVVPGLEVEFMSRWTDTVARVTNVTKLVLFWKHMDTYARRTNTRFVLQEAFDNPWKAEERRTNGWWRLVENANYGDATDYIYEDKEEVSLKEQAEKGKRSIVFTFGDNPTIHGLPSSTESHTTSPEIIMHPEISDSSTGGGGGTGNMMTIVLTSVATGILILAVVGTSAYFLYKQVLRRIGQRGALTDDEIQEFHNGNGYLFQAHPATTPITDSGYNKSLEIARDSFQIDTQLILGAGEFGAVFRGKVKDISNGVCEEVAVKTTKPSAPANALKGLLSEIKVMTYIGRHANIVSLLGAHTAKLHRGKLYLFTELCELGSLEKHLRAISRSELISRADLEPQAITLTHGTANYENGLVTELRILNSELQRWAQEIAYGMEYLASKQVVHADLATRNVLLTKHKTAKISDFGLSRRLYEYASYVKRGQEPLPWKWMSPESLVRSEFNEKSDVWAYGITLWEIFSLGGIPYTGLNWTLEWASTLSQGFRLGKPAYDWNNRYDIMKKCWGLAPDQRPSFAELKSILKTSAQSDLFYIDLEA